MVGRRREGVGGSTRRGLVVLCGVCRFECLVVGAVESEAEWRARELRKVAVVYRYSLFSFFFFLTRRAGAPALNNAHKL